MAGYISDTIQEFFGKLDRIQADLATFSQAIESRGDKISEILEDFEKQCIALQKDILPKHSADMNNVEKALERSINHVNEAISTWRKQVDANRKGTEFMKKNEQYLVVMVFGAVKTGKSSLGNFFAGKEFREASFDNMYQHVAHPPFETEERGRETGDIEKDDQGNTWFSEGVIDTTGAIQYFTLSGLRWIDSPGTGALGKEGDTASMDEMVNEYLPYTDLCIFLMNSSEPGLQDDMRYMEKLSREGQEAIIVITKSDVNDEDEDENGNIVSVLCPKSEEIRKLQEDDICRRVKEAYPSIDENRFRAISVSTHLAKNAIKTENERMYQDSNLDALMKILGDKASDDVVARKERTPKKTLNMFIQGVLEGSSGEKSTPGICDFETDLHTMEKYILEYQSNIDKASERLSKNVRQTVLLGIQEKSREWNQQVNQSGKTVSSEQISPVISELLQQALQQELQKEMNRVIENYEKQEIQRVGMVLKTSGLQKQTAVVEHRYTESYVVEREAEGVIENIRSFFGKKYYRTCQEEHVEKRTVDIGTNLESFLDELMPQIEEFVKAETRKQYTELRDSYFSKQENFIQAMRKEIAISRERLEQLKF